MCTLLNGATGKVLARALWIDVDVASHCSSVTIWLEDLFCFTELMSKMEKNIMPFTLYGWHEDQWKRFMWKSVKMTKY
jgi:hypothetical protein